MSCQHLSTITASEPPFDFPGITYSLEQHEAPFMAHPWMVRTPDLSNGTPSSNSGTFPGNEIVHARPLKHSKFRTD